MNRFEELEELITSGYSEREILSTLVRALSNAQFYELTEELRE